ncbi:hypothetical protein [Enterococcus termitis]|uniref:hypothetical protein n=1 Tax=Enterococcus termitis TaxID=332950 RepID=UPI001112C963|nr:hypothetical protein [Enterococcus termitis]
MFMSLYLLGDDNSSIANNFLIYITILTNTMTISTPILSWFKNISSNRIKHYSFLIGILVVSGIFCWNIIDSSIIKNIISFSSRGGLTALSVSLLLLNLVELDFKEQIEQENEHVKEIERLKEKNKKLLKEKRDQLLKMKQKGE